MLKRTIEISAEPTQLSIEHGQLLIEQEGKTRRDLPLRNRIPCEDIGILIVDERQTTYRHSALVALADAGAVVIICGQNHMPTALILPLSDNVEQVWRLQEQIGAGKVVLKQLWTQIIVAKIRAQAANLGHDTAIRRRLDEMAKGVRSGDPQNIEAQAARAYWGPMLRAACPMFTRQPGKREAPNNLLDYGYAVIRAAVARSLVSAGLSPALGIRHCNRANAFCLADDLMEPLRPMVDSTVRRLCLQGKFNLDQPTKAELLLILTARVRQGEGTGPLQASLGRYAASLVRCFRDEQDTLDIPVRADDDTC